MLTLRPATPADVPTILHFIRELALYEREPDAVTATVADLLRDGFSLAPDGITPLTPAPPTRFICVIADWHSPEYAEQATENRERTSGNPTPAGFALYFTSYSTWLGHHGIRLEDLYVTPALRGRGIGKALLAHVARVAVDQGCPRLEWDVLNWNTPAIAVYEAVGALPQSEWTIMRITGEALTKLSTLSTPSTPSKPSF